MTIDQARMAEETLVNVVESDFVRRRDYQHRRYWKAFLRSERDVWVLEEELSPTVNRAAVRRRIVGGVYVSQVVRETGLWYLPQLNVLNNWTHVQQEEVDWAAFTLRDSYSLSYERIATMLGYAGESGARMAVNRYRSRNLGVQRGYSYELGSGGRRQVLQAVTVGTRTFGVEVEFKELRFYKAAEVVESVTGRHCHSTDYHGRTCHTCRERVGYREWKVEKDGSVCRTDEDGEVTGGEAIAPVGSGDSHLDEIGRVMVALRTAGAIVDRDAGMHVHMHMKDLSREQLAQFVLMFQVQQEFLWGLVAPSRRGSDYCREMTVTEASQIAQQFRTRGEAYGNRGALNIAPYARLGTFEIRMHQGSLNARKMQSWVRLLLAFAQAVKEGRHGGYQANLSVLGSLQADGFLPQQAGAYLFARYAQMSNR